MVYFESEAEVCSRKRKQNLNPGGHLAYMVLVCLINGIGLQVVWRNPVVRQVELYVPYIVITLQFPFEMEKMVFLHRLAVSFCD